MAFLNTYGPFARLEQLFTEGDPCFSILVMTDGLVLPPGAGERVSPSMTVKVGDTVSELWSMFEVLEIEPGFDVGAHLHRNAEELFYVLEGELDLLASEPRVRTASNWQSWESLNGATVAHGGPGSALYVPRGCHMHSRTPGRRQPA